MLDFYIERIQQISGFGKISDSFYQYARLKTHNFAALLLFSHKNINKKSLLRRRRATQTNVSQTLLHNNQWLPGGKI